MLDHSALIKIITPVPDLPVLPFMQELRVQSGTKIYGTVRWMAMPGEDGIVQLLHMQVDPIHQRKGYGSTLMRAVYAEAAKLFSRLEIKPRRIWLSVEQKQQITARAFLSRHGFHHVSTIKNLHPRQDSLIYLRTFD